MNREMLTSKTTWTGITSIVSAAAMYFTGQIEIAAALQMAFTGLIGIFIRNGIANKNGGK